MRDVFLYFAALRVPLFFLGVGVLLAWHPKSMRSLLRGVFDTKTSVLPVIVVAALTYSVTLWLCALAILEGAPARLGLPVPSGWLAREVPSSVFSWGNVHFTNLWLLVLGLALLPSLLCAARLIGACRKGRGLRFLFTLASAGALVWLLALSGPDYWGVATSARWLGRIFHFDPRGYLDPATGHLLRWHVYTTQSILTVFVQLAAYLGFVLLWIRRGRRLPKMFLRWDNFPVLYSVYAMLGLLCLLLSGLGFFLDGYGISLIAVLVLWRLLVWYFDAGSTVGFFRPLINQPTPRQVLAANSAETGGRAIIVCASGGGIHAAAWSTRVLTGLEKEHPGSFAAMVRAVSAVSGGSVGAMNFAGAYEPLTGQIHPMMLDYANELSRMSSLPAALGGWFLFDLPRLFVPWLPSWLNRGWSLERRWDLDGYYSWSLGVWGSQAQIGRRPAVLFNCTAVETGKPVVFASSTLRRQAEVSDAPRPRRDPQYSPSFHELTGRSVDLLVPTAARLSATFPFVSPASRVHPAAKIKPDYSYVDGGYYDNFGVSTPLEFLNQAISETPAEEAAIPEGMRPYLERLSPPVPIRKVLIIEIRAAATAEAKSGRVRFEQLLAPVRTIFAVRSSAQRLHNDAELRMTKEAFVHRGVEVENVVFEYPDVDIPLSWHLTAEDLRRIDEAWDGESLAAQKQVVANFCRAAVRLPLPDISDLLSNPGPAPKSKQVLPKE